MEYRLTALVISILGQSDTALLDWLQNRLDIRRQLTPGRPAEDLSLLRCVRYKLKMGLKVKINQVFGLPGNGSIFRSLLRRQISAK